MKITDINNKFSKQNYIEAEFKELEKECLKNRIPIIDRDAADLLKLQLKIKNPKKILEIGTACGFSTLLLAKYSSAETLITGIELKQARFREAKKNFEKFNYQKKLT